MASSTYIPSQTPTSTVLVRSAMHLTLEKSEFVATNEWNTHEYTNGAVWNIGRHLLRIVWEQCHVQQFLWWSCEHIEKQFPANRQVPIWSNQENTCSMKFISSIWNPSSRMEEIVHEFGTAGRQGWAALRPDSECCCVWTVTEGTYEGISCMIKD